MNRFIIKENDYLKVIFTTEGAGLYQIYLKTEPLTPILVTPKSMTDYSMNRNFYGKTIGRISGRLFGPSYQIDQKTYSLLCDQNQSYMLHGGDEGFWKTSFEVCSEGADFITFKAKNEPSHSFSGTMALEVTYRLIKSALRIEYLAHSDEDTLCNITNHAYFNLNPSTHTILDHELHLNAKVYNVINDKYEFVKQAETKETPFGFETSKSLRTGVMDLIDTAQKGLDHCFIKGEGDYVGTLYEPKTNRKLRVYSNYPSVVIYTHNFASKKTLNIDTPQGIHSSITFECQYEPDGIHHSELHSSILRKHETYKHYIEFKFDF